MRAPVFFSMTMGLAMGLAAAMPAPAAEPTAAGLWQKIEKGKTVGMFLMLDRNGMFEGVIAKMFPRTGRSAQSGLLEMHRRSQGHALARHPLHPRHEAERPFYEGGNVLDPRDGKIYKAKMTLSADGQTLTMRGFVGIALFGKDEVWTRLPDKEMATLDPAIIAKYLPAQAPATKQAPAKKGPATGGAMAPARPPGGAMAPAAPAPASK